MRESLSKVESDQSQSLSGKSQESWATEGLINDKMGTSVSAPHRVAIVSWANPCLQQKVLRDPGPQTWQPCLGKREHWMCCILHECQSCFRKKLEYAEQCWVPSKQMQNKNTQLLSRRTVHSSKGNGLRTPINKQTNSIHIHPLLKYNAMHICVILKNGVGINKKSMLELECLLVTISSFAYKIG